MTTQPDQSREAYDRYNRLYNNGLYRVLTAQMSYHLNRGMLVTSESTELVDLMNAISDVALEICNHPHHVKNAAHVKLANMLYHLERIPEAGLILIVDYLETFAPDKTLASIIPTQMQSIVHALQFTTEALVLMQQSTQAASTLHNWRGRVAHEVLSASRWLSLASNIILMEDDSEYAAEKIRTALKALRSGLFEAKQFGGAWFDFTEFSMNASAMMTTYQVIDMNGDVIYTYVAERSTAGIQVVVKAFNHAYPYEEGELGYYVFDPTYEQNDGNVASSSFDNHSQSRKWYIVHREV